MGRKKSSAVRASKPRLIGKLLTLLPVSSILLYPLYLATQLDICREAYISPLLPNAFSGLKIAFVADIHYGSFLKEDRLRELVLKVNELRPDVLILGGDYGEDSQGALDFWNLFPGFEAAKAVVGVLGNHDRTPPESNLDKLTDAMRNNGVIPLVNDVLMLEKDGKRLALAGIDDYYNGHPKIEKVSSLCESADFTIFIPHTPDVLPSIETPFYQLALCGHTHGGQVSLWGHALHSSSDYGDRFLSGWYHEKGADVLVTNGVGTSSLPVRLGARPQIHLLTLQSK